MLCDVCVCVSMCECVYTRLYVCNVCVYESGVIFVSIVYFNIKWEGEFLMANFI